MPKIEHGGSRTLLEQILDQINIVVSGESGVRWSMFGPSGVEVDGQTLIGAVLTNASGEPIASGDITAGTYDVVRIRAGATTTVVSGAASSKAAGRVYVDYTFASANWQVDDVYYVKFIGIEADTDGDAVMDYTYPNLYHFGQVVDFSTLAAVLNTVKDHLEDATYGLSVLDGEIDDLDSDLVAAKVVIDETNTYLEDGTYGLSALDADLTDIEDKIDVIDGNVDDIETIVSHGTHGNAALDADLTDIENKIDTIDTNVDDIETLLTDLDFGNEALLDDLHDFAMNLGEELVTNGTMEADANWTSWNTPTTNERSNTQVHNGTFSRKLIVDSPSDGISQANLVVKTGVKYKAVAWIYGDATNALQVFIYHSGGTYTYLTTGTTAGQVLPASWTRLEVTFTPTTDGTASIIFGSGSGTSAGTWYGDDFSVRPLTALVIGDTIVDTNTVVNLLNDVSTAEVGTEVDSALNTAVPAVPTARSLNDIVEKDGSSGFDDSKHSLEAIGDKAWTVASFNGTRAVSAGYVDIMDTSGASPGPELTDNKCWLFLGGNITHAAWGTLTVRVQVRQAGDATWRTVFDEDYAAAPYEVTVPIVDLGKAGGPGMMVNYHGLKVSVKCSDTIRFEIFYATTPD